MTATLTITELEVKMLGTEVLRTPVYRDDVYLYMFPTDDPKSAFKRILWKALDEAPSRGGLVPKMIFFTSRIADVMMLRWDIRQWLRERGYPEDIAKSFHGDLTPNSRAAIQASFNKGEISILCCPIAFAIGIDPEGVKYVVVRDTAPPEPDAVFQILDRAARHGLLEHEKAVFFWLPEKKVVGLRDCGLDPAQSRKRRNSRDLPPSMDLTDSSAGETDDNRRRGRKKRKMKPKQRRSDMKPEVYKMYNPPNDDRHRGCYWSTLLARFEETITLPCDNCLACAPNLVCLPELPVHKQEHFEDPKIVEYLKPQLFSLAMDLGSRTKSYLLEMCVPIVSERVLSKVYRDDFANNYLRVLRGDLGDWGWKKKYGQEVIDFIRIASAGGAEVSPEEEKAPPTLDVATQRISPEYLTLCDRTKNSSASCTK